MIVYKYPVPIADEFSLMLPRGARVLHFDSQKDGLFVWALVEPTELPEPRSFRLAGTGHLIEPVDRDLAYVGMALLHGGDFVLHLFELVRPVSGLL